MKRRIIPAIPLALAFALIFTVPVFADVVFFPASVRQLLWIAAAVLVLFCISVAAVLIIVFTRKARNKRKGENK